MGKTCAAPDCLTGHRSEEMRRKLKGIRRISLFTVPKRENMQNKWSKVLKKKLTEKDVICELHFPADTVITKDITVLPDGSFHCLPRERSKLMANAVPLAKRNVDTDKEFLSLEHPDGIEPLTLASIKITECHRTNFEDQGVESELFHDPKDITALNDSSTTETNNFSFDDVLKYLKDNPLRESWSWMCNRDIDSLQIVLTQIDIRTIKIRLFIKINEKLVATVHTGDHSASMEFPGVINSIQMIDHLLETMQHRMTVCCGSGIKYRKRASKCSAFLLNTNFRRFVQERRCPECYRLRKRLRRIKEMKTQKILVPKSKQKKIERLRKKALQLKNSIERVNRMYEADEENALAIAISSIPISQEQTVRFSFKEAKNSSLQSPG